MVAPVLVFAVGNESRGDDALGVLLLRELETWLTENRISEKFELLEDFQLQIENAMDIKSRSLVLFIDAGMDTSAPYFFYRAQIDKDPILYSHALTPEALLNVYAQFYQESPPDIFVLCIRGESFELGEGLSAQAQRYFAQALDLAKKLLQAPKITTWNSLLS